MKSRVRGANGIRHRRNNPAVTVGELNHVVVPGEVLITVHAAGVNPRDWYLQEGYKMLPNE